MPISASTTSRTGAITARFAGRKRSADSRSRAAANQAERPARSAIHTAPAAVISGAVTASMAASRCESLNQNAVTDFVSVDWIDAVAM